MKTSAGIILYKAAGSQMEVFLVHPGGPFWKNKDLGAWSIPKGEFTDEDPLEAAIREFAEETGQRINGNFIPLTPIKQNSGKLVYAWGLQQDIDANSICSNMFEMEWPPKSGLKKFFPEVDKSAWFFAGEAMERIVTPQAAFIKELQEILKENKTIETTIKPLRSAP